MKNLIKKIKLLPIFVILFLSSKNIFAEEIKTFKPTFNKDEANKLVRPIFTDLTNWMLGVIPLITGCYCAYMFFVYIQKDEQEKAQNSYFNTIKKAIFAALVALSITVIFKIFGF